MRPFGIKALQNGLAEIKKGSHGRSNDGTWIARRDGKGLKMCNK